MTGSAGLVGSAVVDQLRSDGNDVVEFDLVAGDDVCDPAVLVSAMDGCDVAVHAAAIPNDSRGTPDQIMRTNVEGTRNLLAAASGAGVRRVVFLSSAQVFGYLEGQGIPSRLPVSDQHPRLARRPYGISKCMGEDLCATWSGRTGISTVALRPVRVIDEETFGSSSWRDFELGGFVHVDDLAGAVLAAIDAPLHEVPGGHVRVVISTAGAYDTSLARRLLAWAPRRQVL